MSFWFEINFHKNQKETTLLRCEQNYKKNMNKNKTINSINQNTYSYCSPKQPIKQHWVKTFSKKNKQKNWHTPRRTNSHFLFSFTFSSSKQPKTNKQKTKKKNTVQIMSDTPCQSPRQITESAIKNQFQFLWNSDSSHQIWRHNKSTESHFWSKSKPRTNRQSWVRNLVVVWFVFVLLNCCVFVFVHSWGFFVSLSLFVVIEFAVLLWSCIFCLCLFFFSFFFFCFVGNCCYYFCSCKDETALHDACCDFNYEQVTKALLFKSVNVNCQDEVTTTPKWYFPQNPCSHTKKTNTRTSQKPKPTKKTKIKNKRNKNQKVLFFPVFFRFFFRVFFFLEFSVMVGHHFMMPVSVQINWMYQITFECWCWLWSKEWGMKQTTKIPKKKTTKEMKWNENKKKTKIAKIWGNFCVKTNVTFFAPKNKCKKMHTLFFFFDHWMLFEFLRFCFVGMKSCRWHRNILTNEKTTKVCGLSCVKAKEKVFHPMTNAKEKIHCVAFSLVLLWWCLSFFLFCWLGE